MLISTNIANRANSIRRIHSEVPSCNVLPKSLNRVANIERAGGRGIRLLGTGLGLGHGCRGFGFGGLGFDGAPDCEAAVDGFFNGVEEDDGLRRRREGKL